MMRISAGDIAKFKAALKNYQHAHKKELIRIETMKREEQARIERERQEKQRQDEEQARQMQESLYVVGSLVVFAGIIAGICFYWESILDIIWYIITIIVALSIVGGLVIALWPILVSVLTFVLVGGVLGVVFILLKEGCGG